MNKTEFNSRVSGLYQELHSLGCEARDIIAKFADSHGGEYTFNTNDEDCIWVGNDNFAKSVFKDSCGNVLILNSGNYSEYIVDMESYNLLDLASYIINLNDNNNEG